jgi:chemotaxis protein methyltransferase CheR
MDHNEIRLTDREFERVRLRLYDVAGISLGESKRTMVVSRLSKVVRGLGLAGFGQYLDHLDARGTPEETQGFVNALTTNLTRFWREDHHFEHLRRQVGTLMTQQPRGTRLRIWSAGCSTGQEPYTIGLDLLAAFPELRRWDFRILATDIDTAVLARAASGVYPDAERQDLTADRARLFEPVGDGQMRVPQAVRDLVAFKAFNLIGTEWPMRGPFDAIFCRNVAIYFDKPTQAKLFSQLAGLLAPEGVLYIGHSENLGQASGDMRLVGKTIYQSTRKSGRAAA